ncbi:MAG: 2-succinyl-6-hydroxy-2,4-cyclohexadiene-1-carboxylate synthase [Verrucomicrobia bacterium]|nr:2-succinyl-6-hydroxy-2,4-cyclohexadiene-1-carboxylate synthase [Verrucomicrobiota bacterium]
MTQGKIYRWDKKGHGPTLICLHGFVGSGSDFEILADHYPDHPTLIAPDFPDYAIDPEVTDDAWGTALSALKKIIEIEASDAPSVLLGYSMGGRIALQFALKYPGLLKALVLVGATPGIADHTDREKRVRADEELATKVANQLIDTFLESWLNQPLLNSQKRIPEPYRSKMWNMRRKHKVQTIAQNLISLGTGSMQPAWKQLPELHLPTFLITGEEDKKFTQIAQQMMQSLPMAQHSTISESGHAACFEQPTEVAKKLNHFLQNLPDL